MISTATMFEADCKQCPRLAGFLDDVKTKYPSYYCKPVPSFGDANAKLLIVGLAPRMHGANKTDRPFTGDHAGILLYVTLYQYGFASKPQSISADDDLNLINCRITNAVKCLPPENKILPIEITTCNQFFSAELATLATNSIILALGSVARLAVLKTYGLKVSQYKFGHATHHVLPNSQVLYDSYHCSRYNTQTKRLTEVMFHNVFATIKQALVNLEMVLF